MRHLCCKVLRRFLSSLVIVGAIAPIVPTAVAESFVRIERDWSTIRDMDGKTITSSNSAGTLVFEASSRSPVKAPDGHQLTLSEFNNVSGSVSAKCGDGGTRFAMHLTGLVPRGVYTMWLFTDKPDGSVSAAGALGDDPEGNGNVVIADEDGEGFLTALQPAGPATANRGIVAPCILTDEFAARLVGAYHLDNASHGRVPGPAGTFVFPFVFKLKRLAHVSAFIRDGSGGEITASAPAGTLIVESRAKNPILAPDGHQLTLGEFNATQGTVSVKCTKEGTRTSLHMNGLIPNGVYTVWLVIFGADPSAGNIGVGALGDDEGASKNVFVADKDGEGEISALNRPGPLSASGNLSACWMTGEAEVHVVGAYHLDGNTHGSAPGAPGEFVEQFAFPFVRAK